MLSQVFTDAEAKRIRDNEPTLSDRPYGVDLPAKLEGLKDAVQAELDLLVVGSATILNGNTSVAIPVGAAFDGKLAVVSFAESPTAVGVTHLWSGPVAGGNLTITIPVDNTADLAVHYVLDGR